MEKVPATRSIVSLLLSTSQRKPAVATGVINSINVSLDRSCPNRKSCPSLLCWVFRFVFTFRLVPACEVSSCLVLVATEGVATNYKERCFVVLT